jgi:hypothetical protein
MGECQQHFARGKIMGYKNLEQQQQAVDAAKFENAKRQTRLHVYQKYAKSVLPCDANDKLIIEIIDRWTGNTDVLPCLALFDEAIAENPAEFQTLAQQEEAVMRRNLIEQIIHLLATRGKGHDDFTLKSEQTRLSTFTIPALRARLADLQLKANMAGQSVQQLKQMVSDARTDRSPYPGFPTLPKSVWNGTTHVPLNAAAFRAMDPWEIRKYSRLYSVEQVNARIAEG